METILASGVGALIAAGLGLLGTVLTVRWARRDLRDDVRKVGADVQTVDDRLRDHEVRCASDKSVAATEAKHAAEALKRIEDALRPRPRRRWL